MIDLELMPTDDELAALADLLDEDNMALHAAFVRKCPAMIRELRAARECVEVLKSFHEVADEVHFDSAATGALAAYDAAVEVSK